MVELVAKEIERKWIWNYEQVNIYDFFDVSKPLKPLYDCHYISDFYFNDLCRLRKVNDDWFVTIKSRGHKIRDEFEFPVNFSESVDFVPSPLLNKIRCIYYYEDNAFEINIYSEIVAIPYEMPLIIVELENDDPSRVKELPEICGKEVTYNSTFYGYNLYKHVATAFNTDLPPKDNVIEFKKFDK